MNYIVLILTSICLLGCSTTTNDPAKNAKNAGINAAGSAALREAGKVLGRVAVQSLVATAQGELTGKKVDLLSSAASGLWSQANSGTTSEAIGNITAAYTAGKAKQTASTAAAVAAPAIAQGKNPSTVANAIASVLSTVAGAPPKL